MVKVSFISDGIQSTCFFQNTSSSISKGLLIWCYWKIATSRPFSSTWNSFGMTCAWNTNQISQVNINVHFHSVYLICKEIIRNQLTMTYAVIDLLVNYCCVTYPTMLQSISEKNQYGKHDLILYTVSKMSGIFLILGVESP